MRSTYRLLLVLSLTVPNAFADMYKCRLGDGSTMLQNWPCGAGEGIISINGVSYEEIQQAARERQRKERAEADRLARAAAERARAEAIQRSLTSSQERATPSVGSQDSDREYDRFMSKYNRASSASKNAYADMQARRLREQDIGISSRQMRGFNDLEAELMRGR